jgi:hypothetical protein
VHKDTIVNLARLTPAKHLLVPRCRCAAFQSLILEAAAALENVALVGQPALQEDAAGGPDAPQAVRAPEGGMYMGS